MQILSACLRRGLTEEFLQEFYQFDLSSLCLEDICRFYFSFFIFSVLCAIFIGTTTSSFTHYIVLENKNVIRLQLTGFSP